MDFHHKASANLRLKAVVNEIRLELRFAERRHLSAFNEQIYTVDYFDSWLKEQLRLMTSFVKDLVTEFAGERYKTGY